MNYDLIVVGGGISGVNAAIAAAREKRKVLVIECSGFLGGSAVNCLVNPFMRYWSKDERGQNTAVNGGLFLQILNRLEEKGGLLENKVTFNEEILKIVLDELTEEYHIDVLFHSYLVGVGTENERITEIRVANKSGVETYRADYFIDATGDGDLAYLAGCPYHVGRKEDECCQPMTLCFRLSSVDVETFHKNREKILALYQQYQREGKITNPRENILTFEHIEKGVVHFNSTRIVRKNPLNARELSAAEQEARKQVFELYSFLKKHADGFQNSNLIMSAPQIGVRESRMIEGMYEITAEDIMQCRKFEDSVSRGAYGIDIHNPDGSGTVQYHIDDHDFYTIPYRAMVNRLYSNFLVTGRCISSTHEAQSAYRIIPICSNLGEAAGMAVSLALQEQLKVGEIDINRLHRLMDTYHCLY